jgi:hypothetical protein
VISHLAEVNRMQFEIWQEKFNRYNQVLDQRRGTLLSTAAPGLAALT